MKRLSICSSWISVILLIVGFATGKAMAQAGDVVVHAATVDLTHFTGTEPVDQIDMTTTFTNNEFKELRHCEAADSLILHGVKVGVQQGLCGSATHITNMTIPFFKPLSPTLAVFEGLTMYHSGGSPPRDFGIAATVVLSLVVTVGSFIFAGPLLDIARDAASVLNFPN